MAKLRGRERRDYVGLQSLTSGQMRSAARALFETSSLKLETNSPDFVFLFSSPAISAIFAIVILMYKITKLKHKIMLNKICTSRTGNYFQVVKSLQQSFGSRLVPDPGRQKLPIKKKRFWNLVFSQGLPVDVLFGGGGGGEMGI
jgi:hypothetical protein